MMEETGMKNINMSGLQFQVIKNKSDEGISIILYLAV